MPHNTFFDMKRTHGHLLAIAAASLLVCGCSLLGQLRRGGNEKQEIQDETAQEAPSQAADEAGISIPGQLSLLGFDNIDYAALPNIRLTTIDHPIPQLARSSTKLLLEIIESGDMAEYTHKMLVPTLIERCTCRNS